MTTTTLTRAGLAPVRQPWAHPAFAPVAIGLLGLAISLTGITTPSIWYDEAATISSATRSWPQLWAELGNVDAVHGLYYALMHVVFDIAGYSPLALRAPSALAIGVAAALVVVLGRQLRDNRLGVVAGLVFVVIPRVAWAGTEGRSYAITALLAVLLTIVFVRAQRDGRRWPWVLYSVVAVVSVSVFIYLALVIVAHGTTLVWRWLRRERMAVYFGRRWALAAGAAAVACIPLSLEIVSQTGQVDWIPEIGPSTPQQLFSTQWFAGALLFAVVAWALIVFGAVRGGSIRRVVLPALVVPPLALVAVSLVRDALYLPRYLTMGTPFVAIAIAVGITAIGWRLAPVVAVALLAVLALPAIVAQRGPEAKENTSWNAVADFIAADRAADGPGTSTAFIYGNLQRHPSATARVMAYSYPAAFADSIDATILTPAAETAQLWETRAPIAATVDRLAGADVAYLITSNARDLRPETTRVMERAGWHVELEWDFTTGHVIKYERDGQ